MFKDQKNFQFPWRAKKTSLMLVTILSILFFSNHLTAQSEVIDVATFDEVIVSPHIEVIFQEGKKVSVVVEYITVPNEILNVEVRNNTLHLFLDGAKITTNKKKEQINGSKCKTSIYDGTIVKAIVTYKKLNAIDLRGEEKFVFESKLKNEKLRLNIYGEAQVYLNEVDIHNLKVSIYGESCLEILQGAIENQTYRVYGDSEINASNIDNAETKITAYGDGDFRLNIAGKLIVTSYGDATIKYYGKPVLQKRIVIGDSSITKINRNKAILI